MSQYPVQIVSSSLHELYKEVLKSLLTGEIVSSVRQKNSIGSSWGTKSRKTRELRYVNLILNNPLNRMVDCSMFRLTSAFPRTLLSTLSDEKNLDVLLCYNPRAAEFSDDGMSIPTNYGHRIRHFAGYDQLQLVIDQLKEDPFSRRAVIHIHSVEDYSRRYTPCIDSIHFLIREGKLECQAFWRSENALTLLPYNIFEFTMLQELVASELHVPIGCFVQSVSSLHYYLDDEERVHKTINELDSNKWSTPMNPMPFNSLSTINTLREMEKKLRGGLELEGMRENLPKYWNDFFDVVEVFHFQKRNKVNCATSMIENSCWKDLMLQHV